MNFSLAPQPDALVLQAALLVYRNTSSQVLMRGLFEERDGQVVIAEMEPVTENLRKMLLAEDKRRPLSYVPPGVVGITSDSCGWFVPAQKRVMLFKGATDASLAAISGQEFPQPPLVMVTWSRGMSIYALRDNERPTLDTPLMQAPYFNIFDDGGVCLGSTKVPANGSVANTTGWEAAFYSSHFTHRSGTAARWTPQFTHLELWQAAAAKGAFDPEWLVPANKTLGEVLCTG
ncbi:PRTRC system protein B [Deinococcus ficus]|uniref:PRTRC system protein B n=1 Tax=Deinococcus ficus TaxID=317577 RepID=A0A221T311_9DEIO|nr:PRTRC system protein B [Deinococcus ficus]ASN83236.1 hypothetical protein DFI_18740 [Deinococcus ficus]